MLRRFALPRPTATLIVVPALVALALGFDAWSTSEAREQNQQAIELERKLDASATELRQRYEAKRALINDLVAGRTTLAEATAQFTILNRDRPECVEAIRRNCPGGTDEEKMARNVLGFVDAALSVEPAATRRVVRARLEAELAAMLDPHPSPATE